MIEFFRENAGKILEQTLTHVGLTFLSLLLALAVGLPLGCWLTRRPKLAPAIIGFTGVLQTVPSIALLGILIPVMGIGATPAVFALFLYGLLPIVRNTYTGVSGVEATLTDAARGMGMTGWQILTRVELPLALPVIFAGIRTATVINVGVATLAAYVAAGGLGEFIFGGIALSNTAMILAGAVPAALLAVLLDVLLGWLQQKSRAGNEFDKNFSKRPLGNRATLALLFGVVSLAAVYAVPKAAQTRLLAGFAHEFAGRADGYPGLQKTYGLEISTLLLDQSLMYEAIRQGHVDVISGYSTDGRIKAYNLRVLNDDRQAFPPYQAAWVVRRQTLQRLPQLQPVLDLLAKTIRDADMTDLNYAADYQKQSPETVARRFLEQRGLLNGPPFPGPAGTVTIGSKVFTEQYILAEMLRQLIEQRTTLRVAAKTGLGGTQICFDALRTGGIDLYPEYTGTGLLVVLQPPQSVLDSLHGDRTAVYDYVKHQFANRYQLDWQPPLGFNNAYALMMRNTQAQRLNIRTISELKGYLER